VFVLAFWDVVAMVVAGVGILLFVVAIELARLKEVLRLRLSWGGAR
jgi:hypothetical protein